MGQEQSAYLKIVETIAMPLMPRLSNQSILSFVDGPFYSIAFYLASFLPNVEGCIAGIEAGSRKGIIPMSFSNMVTIWKAKG